MKKLLLILIGLCSISLVSCDESVTEEMDQSVSLDDVANGEGKLIIYGDVNYSFSGDAFFETTNTFLGTTFNPDYMLDEYTMYFTAADFSAMLQLRFFIEYPESAADNIEIYTEQYNIIDLNDTDGGGVLYAFPFLQVSNNSEISHSAYPDGAVNYAEIVNVTSDYVEGVLYIEDVENSEGDTYTIEAAFKAARQ